MMAVALACMSGNSMRRPSSRQRRRSVGLALLCLLLLGLYGCDSEQRPAEPPVAFVELRSAEGLAAGAPVYVAGVAVGATTSPRVVSGKARVGLHLHPEHQNALYGGLVFLMTEDPSQADTSALVAFDYATDLTRDEEGVLVFQGASSRAELVALVGADAALQLWDDLVEWIQEQR